MPVRCSIKMARANSKKLVSSRYYLYQATAHKNIDGDGAMEWWWDLIGQSEDYLPDWPRLRRGGVFKARIDLQALRHLPQTNEVKVLAMKIALRDGETVF